MSSKKHLEYALACDERFGKGGWVAVPLTPSVEGLSAEATALLCVLLARQSEIIPALTSHHIYDLGQRRRPVAGYECTIANNMLRAAFDELGDAGLIHFPKFMRQEFHESRAREALEKQRRAGGED